ncbi:MAG: XdhC family protein, partial [Bacteroidota bacterium]
VIQSGEAKLMHYGVTDEEAWTVGLSCGGKIDVFIFPFFNKTNPKVWLSLKNSIHLNKAASLVFDIDNKPHFDFIENEAKESSSISESKYALSRISLNQRKHVLSEHKDYFSLLISKKSQLIIIGAAHITVDLVSFAKQFGFETIVIDPRGFFTNNTQFQIQPDQLISDWPAEVLHNMELDQFTYAVTLSHDPKIDDQALEILLNANVAYIGALGSKRTHAKRIARLETMGFDQTLINKIHAPVGVSIQAKSPKEIALSVIAQIIAVKNQFL